MSQAPYAEGSHASLLVQGNADAHARDHRAAAAAIADKGSGSRTSVAQLLLERGADGSLTDRAGQTALDISLSVDAAG